MNEADGDREALAALRDSGSDLAIPHDVAFYMYLPTNEEAAAASGLLERDGFQTIVRAAALGPGWLCLASLRIVPSLERITSERKRFEDLASRFSGEFDGWEATVVDG